MAQILVDFVIQQLSAGTPSNIHTQTLKSMGNIENSELTWVIQIKLQFLYRTCNPEMNNINQSLNILGSKYKN